MKRYRWDLIVSAALIALGLVLHAALPRYEYAANGLVLDRWTGEVCSRQAGCWRAGMRVSGGGDARLERLRDRLRNRPVQDEDDRD